MPVEFNKKIENPFHGMSKVLNVLTSTISNKSLNDAFEEVKDSKEKKELFYSILFSIGDITNRQHNIFRKKVDNGGRAERESFYLIMNWMRDNDYEQFKKFLFAGLFDEYTCFDHLFRNRVETYPGTIQVKKEYNMFNNPTYCEDLADYVVSIIKGNNPFKKMLVAKFLTMPRLGKRAGRKGLLPQTYRLMLEKAGFLKKISDKMGWNYKLSFGYSNFYDYRKWRQDYNQDLESVLFSTGKIKDFDVVEFKTWLNKLPSGARYRVKNRLLYSYKEKGKYESGYRWEKQRQWFIEWEEFKAKMQQEERILAEKVRQGTASEEDKLRLVEVTKEAKVTTGATTFKDIYADICSRDVDWLKVESFLNKVHLDYNMLTIIDDSGSMTGAPYNFAKFLATVLLTKNPDDIARNTIVAFSRSCRIYSGIDKTCPAPSNFFSRVAATDIPKTPFIIPEKSFKENYERISNFLDATMEGSGTYLDSVACKLIDIARNDLETADVIRQYPVWCLISDGDINRLPSAAESIREFQIKMEDTFGFTPFIILIDVSSRFREIKPNEKFGTLDNFIYIPSDPAMIEQVLTNFKDMDRFDVYTPLLSIYRSNRYELVRQNVI